jgi:hypothetical protein
MPHGVLLSTKVLLKAGGFKRGCRIPDIVAVTRVKSKGWNHTQLRQKCGTGGARLTSLARSFGDLQHLAPF